MSLQWIVLATDAKFDALADGGLQLTYMCPSCSQQLETRNEGLMQVVHCPNCKVAITFEKKIHDAVRFVLAEKHAKEQTKRDRVKAEEASNQKKQAGMVSTPSKRVGISESSARDISDASRTIRNVHFLGTLGGFLGVFGSAFMAADPNLEPHSGQMFSLSVSALLTANIVYAFFRVLESIHAVLVRILDHDNAFRDHR